MSRHGYSRQRLALETLEERHALAGNVVAVQTGSTLTILGDEQANGVSISYDVVSRTHRVAGFSHAGSATLVNGAAASPDYGGVKHIQVWLGDGDDKLDFGAADRFYTEIAQKLSIDMGAGNDTLELGRSGNAAGGADPVQHRLYVGKGIYVDLGAGHDTLEAANLKTSKSLIVRGGSGDDTIEFATEFTPAGATQAVQFPVTINGNLHLNLGDGNDTATLLHARVEEHVKLHDTSGTSAVVIADVSIGKKLDIVVGHGDDQVILDYVRADDLKVISNGGDDYVKIDHSRFKRWNVKTGGGSDDLTIRNSRGTQYARLDGGEGGADLAYRNNKIKGLVRRRLS